MWEPVFASLHTQVEENFEHWDALRHKGILCMPGRILTRGAGGNSSAYSLRGQSASISVGASKSGSGSGGRVDRALFPHARGHGRMPSPRSLSNPEDYSPPQRAAGSKPGSQERMASLELEPTAGAGEEGVEGEPRVGTLLRGQRRSRSRRNTQEGSKGGSDPGDGEDREDGDGEEHV